MRKRPHDFARRWSLANRPRRSAVLGAATLVLALAAGCGGGGKSAAAGPAFTAMTPSAHAAIFPLLGTPHDPTVPASGVTCAGCHPGNTFAQFSCTTCHTAAKTDPTHLGVAVGYVSPPTSAACLNCHPQGLATMVDHARFFPIGTTSHPATCAACHTDPLNRASPATLACATCHTGLTGFSQVHAQVKDYDPSPTGCVRCHGDDQVDRVAAHQGAFPVAPGSSTHDTVCLHCHTSVRTDKPFAADFTAFSCVACHQNPATDTAHAGVTGYQYADASCYQCHPGGTVAAPVNHATALFPIGTGTAHAAVTCSQCHQGPANQVASLGCASCHGGLSGFATAHAQVKDYDPSPAGCVRCHGDSQVERVAAHQGLFPVALGSGTHDTVCLDCHTGVRTDKPFAADFTAFACTACHLKPDTDQTHATVTGYQYASASCYGCHPDGSGGAPANHATAFFPIGAGSAHQGITCSQCHLGAATDLSQLGCASCHLADPTFAATHTGPASGVSILAVHTSQNSSTNLALTSPNCLRCHADSQVDLIASHPRGDSGFGTGQHRTAGCMTCHSATRTDKPFGANTATTPGCVTCHPNGTPN